MKSLSRRDLWRFAGAGALAAAGSQRTAFGQQVIPPAVPAEPIFPYTARSPVSLVKGEDRRQNVLDALTAVDKEILPRLRQKKYVIIKVNNVSTTVQLAATHVDALRGILDYLAPRYQGPVVIAESSAEETPVGFENFQYAQVISEYKPREISLVDLNQEGKYEVFSIVDGNVRPIAVRLAARLLDPDAFVISSAMPKTHNAVVATLSVKNMAMGSPLHSVAGASEQWHDKRLVHARGGSSGQSSSGRPRFRWNPHAMNFNLVTMAKRLQPNWGVAVIDGYEAMEGNGPINGESVPLRIAMASPDFIAADRVGIDIMGIPGHAVGYLQYAGQLGLGQYDLAKIDIRGEKPASVRRSFRLGDNVEDQFRWLQELMPSA